MWEAFGYLIILILACYGVYYLTQDLFRFVRYQPGPPVSMLVVVRNREMDVEYLMRRMHAWHKRQWPEIEIVVVDDGSTDETNAILQRLQQKLSFRLINLEQAEEMQEDHALQSGLLHCHNALVWLIDFRKLPQGLQAEWVFRVFFCQSWR